MKTIRQFLGILIAGILLFFLIKPFAQTHTHLKDVAFQVQWRWFMSSFCLILFYWSAYLYPFATLIGSITEKHVSFRTVYTLFHLANITRYLPGRIWGVVRLLSLSHRFGLSKTATASSLTLHVGIETALGGILALSLFLSKQMRDTAQIVFEKMSGHTVLFTLTVIGILAGLLFCIPKVASQARQFLKTLVPLLKNERLWVNIVASHILLWMCQGLAFFLFVKSLVDVPWTDAGILTTCYAFAWIVGFLSFLTPGGLGIREGILGLLLANYMQGPQAVLVTLLCRVWILSAEIVLAGIALLLQRKHHI